MLSNMESSDKLIAMQSIMPLTSISRPPRAGFFVVPFIGLTMCYSVGTGMSKMRQMLAMIPGVAASPVLILWR